MAERPSPLLSNRAARFTIAILAILGVNALACGGGSRSTTPTSPTPVLSPPPPPELVILGRVVEYRTGRPIPGSVVTTSLQVTPVTADANGEFHIAGYTSPRTFHVTIEAQGYITRETFVRLRDGTRNVTIDLLREGDGFSLEYYRQLARDSTRVPTYEPLWRLTENPSFYVRTVDQNGKSIEPEVLRGVYDAIRKAVADWSARRLTVATLETGIETRPRTPGWIVVNILREKDTEYCGLAEIGAIDGQIQLWNDVCSCGSNKLPGALIAHEVGHALGFFHVTEEDAVMFPTIPGGCPNGVLSTRERSHAAVAYSRSRWNADLDIDSDTMTPLSARDAPTVAN